jgi:hypothetical protein
MNIVSGHINRENEVNTSRKEFRLLWIAELAAMSALMLTAGCEAMKSGSAAMTEPSSTATAMNPTPMASETTVTVAGKLSGTQEVPANPSTATGRSTITIGADKSVTGSVQVKGMTPTMAHIHEGAKGSNGPVIVPFTKTAENTFAPAPGTTLTDAQYASYLAGKLYINVHSAAYPGGEVRLQIVPDR